MLCALGTGQHGSNTHHQLFQLTFCFRGSLSKLLLLCHFNPTTNQYALSLKKLKYMADADEKETIKNTTYKNNSGMLQPYQQRAEDMFLISGQAEMVTTYFCSKSPHQQFHSRSCWTESMYVCGGQPPHTYTTVGNCTEHRQVRGSSAERVSNFRFTIYIDLIYPRLYKITIFLLFVYYRQYTATHQWTQQYIWL